MPHLILPKDLPNLGGYEDRPLFFLAGPIQGGDDWQETMGNRLTHEIPDCIIVNPSRYEYNHPQHRWRMPAPLSLKKSQKYWERHFMRLAGRDWGTGCIIFWLACESAVEPRKDGNPYAMDTLGEIGEWRGHLMHDPTVRLAVGAENGFRALDGIKNDFDDAFGETFKIYDTMEEVIERAIHFSHPSLSFAARTSA